jgi:hypothetical protein
LTENGADRLVDMIHEHIVSMKSQSQLKLDAVLATKSNKVAGGSSSGNSDSKALILRYKDRETLY